MTIKNVTLLCLLSAVLAGNTPAQEAVQAAPDLAVVDSPLLPVSQTGQDVGLAVGLQSVPGVQVIPQGLAGGQSDLSIRGSGFSGAGLTLAGLALRNPQTEHFHAELPFPGHWMGGPDVRSGVRQAALGDGHLVGTVALAPLPIADRRLVTAGIAEKGGYWANGNLQQALRRENGNTLGLGLSGGTFEAFGVDFPDNDVKVSRGAAQVQHLSDKGQADLWLGRQDKDFGTRGYYGVNPLFPSTESTRDSMVLGSWLSADPTQPLDASFLLREFEDDYKLVLPTSLFRNQHTSVNRAAQVGQTRILAEDLKLHARVAAEQESIESKSLGNFERSRLALTLLPELALATGLRVSLGGRGEWLEGDEDVFLPLARVDADLTGSLSSYIEHSQSVRRPSYTELNYESPGSLGNAGLANQVQEANEIGLRWQACEASVLTAALFQRRTYDAVDWVRPDATAPRWLAENIGRVDSTGAELALWNKLGDATSLIVSSAWLDKDADDAPYSSRYFLDYAEWYSRLMLDWAIHSHVRLEATQGWRQQVDNALRDAGGDEQALASVALHLRCPAWTAVQFSLMADNLWNDDYRTFPGQDTWTGRRYSASVTVDW